MMRLLATLAISLAAIAGGSPVTHARAVEDRVYYQIFVRSFQDSDGDGIGDLRGITSRLDYLAGLGVGGIWLTPIFASPSYHGYDTTDYRSVHPELGTIQDLDELVDRAHERGIRVLLDLAINHTSRLHPWFADRKRYVWRAEDPAWPGPRRWHRRDGAFYYAFFGPGLPDLDLGNEEVLADLSSAARFWIERGVDGFRLDAIRYYVEGPRGESDTPETHAMIRRWAGDLRARFPGTLFVGEAWADLATIAPYVHDGREMDLAFHFPASGGLVHSLKSRAAAPFAGALRETAARGGFSGGAPFASALAPFVTNHDMVRVATELGARSSHRAREPRLKLAAAALLSQPGTPFVYYGEEIGMTNGPRPAESDLGKRTPMQWSAAAGGGFTEAGVKPWQELSSADPAITVEAQQGGAGSLLETYRELIRLRREHPAMGAGGAMRVLAASREDCVAFLREGGGERVVVALDFGGKGGGVEVDLGGAAGGPRTIWGGARAEWGSAGRLRVSGLEAFGAAWIRL